MSNDKDEYFCALLRRWRELEGIVARDGGWVVKTETEDLHLGEEDWIYLFQGEGTK